MCVMLMFQSIVKVRGCAWWGVEFISLRIPTSGGLHAHVINTVSQNWGQFDQQSCFIVSRNYQISYFILRLRTTLMFHMRRPKL